MQFASSNLDALHKLTILSDEAGCDVTDTALTRQGTVQRFYLSTTQVRSGRHDTPVATHARMHHILHDALQAHGIQDR